MASIIQPGYIHDWPPNFNKYLERCACLDEDFFITTTYPYLVNIFIYIFGYIENWLCAFKKFHIYINMSIHFFIYLYSYLYFLFI